MEFVEVSEDVFLSLEKRMSVDANIKVSIMTEVEPTCVTISDETGVIARALVSRFKSVSHYGLDMLESTQTYHLREDLL